MPLIIGTLKILSNVKLYNKRKREGSFILFQSFSFNFILFRFSLFYFFFCATLFCFI